MKQVMLDGATLTKLLAPGGPVDMADEVADLIGRFVPYTPFRNVTRLDEVPSEAEPTPHYVTVPGGQVDAG